MTVLEYIILKCFDECNLNDISKEKILYDLNRTNICNSNLRAMLYDAYSLYWIKQKIQDDKKHELMETIIKRLRNAVKSVVYRELKENNAFVNYIKNYRATLRRCPDENSGWISGYLISDFQWHSTKEGDRFWRSIYYNIVRDITELMIHNIYPKWQEII